MSAPRTVKTVDNVRRFSIWNHKQNSIRKVENLLSPEQQIDKIREKNVQLIQGEQLYKHGILDFHNKIYEHYDEIQICSPDEKGNVILDLIYKESYQKLSEVDYSLIYLGLILIGIIGMHKKGLGTKLLVNLVDTRHSESVSKDLIALVQVDMNKNLELVYITPNSLVSLSTLHMYINISIKAKGYTVTSIEPNLLITKVFTSQVANGSSIRCTLKPILKVSEILGSKGVEAFEAEYYSSELKARLE